MSQCRTAKSHTGREEFESLYKERDKGDFEFFKPEGRQRYKMLPKSVKK